MATYGGVNIFGKCLSCQQIINPAATQNNEFFGVDGTHSLYGGTRGRVFAIKGAFVGASAGGCLSAESLLLTYIDGRARILVDNQGRAFPNVIMDGRYQADPRGPLPTVFGGLHVWTLQYELEMRGLT